MPIAPTRRPSASHGPGASSRAHRAHDSQGLGSMGPTNPPPSIAYSATSATPQQKIVQTLINRLKNKLPCNSGLTLDYIEGDNATLRAVEALVHLARDSMDIIAWSLSELLERLAKQTDATGHLSVEVLQSQLFILKVLNLSMATRWNAAAENILPTRKGKKSTGIMGPSRMPDSPLSKQSREGSISTPPPSEAMDDNCARYILSVMVLYLRQTTPQDLALMSSSILALDSSYYDFESADVPSMAPGLEGLAERDSAPPTPQPPSLHAKHSIGSVNSNQTPSTTPLPHFHKAFEFEKTHMSMAKSSHSLNNFIGRFSGRIIYQLSASNWNIVYQRIRNKVHHLSSTTEDHPDTVDLQLMTWCAMDRTKLIGILQVLSSLLVNMKREAQAAVAVPLRKAVWNWIDLYPDEFNEAIRSRGRMEGAPERTFDLLYTAQHNIEKELWPTLTILVCISAERISSDFQVSSFGTGNISGHRGSHRKDHRFLEELIRHANGNSKLNEIALVCVLDICRVAFRVRPNEQEVSLRLIASDIAHELKVALHKTHKGKPFWEHPDEIDIPLCAETLANIFRFLPEDDSVSLFLTCLEPERSEAVKMVAARGALLLALEAKHLPWQKALKNLASATAQRFRDIYRAAASRRNEIDEYGNIKKAAPRPKAKRVSTDILSDRELLLLALLSLWRADGEFYLAHFDYADVDEFLASAVKLWDAPIDISVKISATMSTTLISHALPLMVPSDPYYDFSMRLMERTMPAVLLAVVTNLLDARSDVEVQRLWITASQEMVRFYRERNERSQVRAVQRSSNRVPAFAMAEIAFLISLTSADKGISHIAADGLRFIAQAERQPNTPVNSGISNEERAKRHSVYEQLGDPNVIVFGRVEQQKRMRKLMRGIAHPAATYIAVWEECYWRWRSLCEVVVKSPLDPISSQETYSSRDDQSMSPDEKMQQWKNLTLFLAAFGGTCVVENHDSSALLSVIPAQFLPDEMRVLQNPTSMVSTFITELTDLLIAEAAPVREVAREALGSELHPRLYARIFRHLEEVTRDVTDGADHELSESFATFLDQFTYVLKQLLEKPDIPLEDVGHIDVSTTLVALAGFIARFHNPLSSRIRLKLCALCDCVCERTETLTLRRDTPARYNIIDILMEWIQDPSTAPDGDSARDQCNMNLACLRTAVNLLDNLDLKPLEDAFGDETGHTISRLYIRYSTVLLKGLDQCQPDPLTSDSISDVPSLQRRIRISQREADLRELVVTGLSHLVKANTEMGLKNCLPLAYDPDIRKRTIFSRVFARVLDQGTKFDQADSNVAPKPNKLCELVKEPNMLLALAICDVCPSAEVDVIISVLMNLYDTRASLVKLLKFMIDREIAHTDSEATLFRSNSTTTRFLSAFAKTHGYNYLRSLINPLLQMMSNKAPGHSYDLDPTRAIGQDLDQNRQNVQTVAAAFLGIIKSSVPAIPPMFREVCAYIAKSVMEVWPEAKFAALGAFIFLRFISPAVVQPELVDVEVPKDDSDVIRRGLKVIAKVIQNLANNIFFGKEQHMVPLNNFLHDNIVNVTRYLNDIVKLQEQMADEDEGDEWLGTTADDTDTIVLHRFFAKHGDKIGKDLLSQGKVPSEDDNSQGGKDVWIQLCGALMDIGDPLEVPHPSPLICSDHEEYIDLMSRHQHRNTDHVKDIFVETKMPQDQPAVFVLRVCNIDVEALDVEVFMYHIFKTLALPSYKDRLFEVILDCTAFTSMSEVPVNWIKYCTEVVPSDIRTRFLTSYILNPNNQTQRYLRRLYNISAGTPFSNGVRAYSSVAELLEHVPEACAIPLAYPLGLEDERREVFTEVMMRQAHQMRMPVVLEIGASHIRITSVKAQPLSPHLACKSTEILSLKDVSDIYNVSTGQDPHEFIIRRARQGVTLFFSSQLRDTIVKTIRTAKSQLKDGQRALMERPRTTNTSATLLHVGMYSLDHDDEELRSASYELLGAVCKYLDFENNPILAPQAGFIPEDPHTFALQMSERLAQFAPRLTLDFVTEASSGMGKADEYQRINCLQYISPWIANLAKFCDPGSMLYEHSGAKLRDTIRLLVDITTANFVIPSAVQQYIWSEISHQDSVFVNMVLDELMRAAVDGGVGSKRCEDVARTIATLSTINVRGRIFAKLRKILGKTSMKPSKTLIENVHWVEIATLTRLAFFAGNHSRQATYTQLYLPEIVHLAVLVAGTGPTIVRKSVYGIVFNFLQSMYFSRTDGDDAAEIMSLVEEFTQPQCLQLFGLARTSSTSEYSDLDPVGDKMYMETQENLAELLVRVLEITAGSQGLLNVWRARWMGLITSMVFQYSPAIQARGFIALGTLGTQDVDDDLMYQMLVAFKVALASSSETDTVAVVCMLRCIVKVVSALPHHSKYFDQLFWLAVALLQSSHLAFYIQATDLLRVTIETAYRHGLFEEASVAVLMMEGRHHLDETLGQLDRLLGLSFESSFSYSLACVIFKGMRHSVLKASAEAVLRVLLRVAIETRDLPDEESDGTVHPDVLAYFLALLPLCRTPKKYAQLLEEADASGPDTPDIDDIVPRVNLDILNVDDQNAALLLVSFVAAMLTTAQGDDAETEMLYTLLSDVGHVYPDTVSMAYDGLQDRIKETFSNSSNPNIIKAVSNIFRIALQDPVRLSALRGSASTVGTTEETAHGPGKAHLLALDDLHMRGLASSFQFLPPNRGHATKIITWIPELVTKIIENI